MKAQLQKTWEIYIQSWKVTSEVEKRALFEQALAAENVYTDPMVQTTSWQALIEYMMDFNQQFQGCYFVLTDFMAHNNKSVARWNMVDVEERVLLEGISYGEYNAEGKLISETGFYEMERLQSDD